MNPKQNDPASLQVLMSIADTLKTTNETLSRVEQALWLATTHLQLLLNI
jgi:hypothetical protein